MTMTKRNEALIVSPALCPMVSVTPTPPSVSAVGNGSVIGPVSVLVLSVSVDPTVSLLVFAGLDGPGDDEDPPVVEDPVGIMVGATVALTVLVLLFSDMLQQRKESHRSKLLLDALQTNNHGIISQSPLKFPVKLLEEMSK